MERSEPALVPEWLRSAGGVTGGGSSVHHSVSSSSHADVSSLAHSNRGRTSKSSGDFDSPRSSFLDRTSSLNSRRSSVSNGSTKHAYSSFSRSHRDRDREREKERTGFGDPWDLDSDPLGNLLTVRVEKDTLRRSHSMVSRKQGELSVRRGAVDMKNGGNSNHYNGNGVLPGGSAGSSIPKVVFDKDFPALGAEEKQGLPDIGRVSSPGLSTAVQSLPLGNSSFIGGEGWSSALAEVPKIIGSGSISSSNVQQNVAVSSGAPSTMTGLNMAEALAQPPSRVRTPPQLSVKTQRREELAIKQSRQLIPVTPSMPKTVVSNSSDKSKPKTAARASETVLPTKSGQQQQSSFHLPNQSLKSETQKKFVVLKPPVWENGASSSPKDATSPSNAIGNRVASSQSTVAPLLTSAPSRSSSNQKPLTVDRKAAPMLPNHVSVVEKRPSSQVQSRNDFFNLVRKKSSMNTGNSSQDSGPTISSQSTEKSGEAIKEIGSSAPESPLNGSEAATSGDAQRSSDVGEESLSFSTSLYPDEEEAAFLRSLGWDENAGEDEGLTEEEISAFYEEYMKLKPSLKLCRDMQLRLSMLSESHATSLNGPSSEFSTSDSRSKA